MSIQAISWVLDHSPAKGADRLVLISLANHAGKNPTNGAYEMWPGVELIAKEAGIARTRTVQECLARLEAAGAIQRIRNGAPDERIRKDRRPNLYRLIVSDGVTDAVMPSDDQAPGEPDSRGDANRQPVGGSRGDVSRPNGVSESDRTGCREPSPEPSLKPSGNRGRRWPDPTTTVAFDQSEHPILKAERLRKARESA